MSMRGPGVRPAPGHGAQDAGLFGPAGYRRQTPPKRPKLEPFTGVIDRILEDDLRRSSATRTSASSSGCGTSTVSTADIPRSRTTSERIVVRPGRFVPLSHPPGHAQCDFGEALVVIGGVERKAHCFVIDLPHSDGCFVKAYPAEKPRPSWTATSRPSPTWAVCPRASSTTIPSWPWR